MQNHSFAAMTDEKTGLRKFGLRVQQIRVENGMTQEQLAEAMDVTPLWVQQLELGEMQVRLLLIAEIADAFQMRIADMFPADF